MINSDFYFDILLQLDFGSALEKLQREIQSKIPARLVGNICITGNGDSYISGYCMEMLSRVYHHDQVRAITVADAAYTELFDERTVLVSVSISGNSNTLAIAMEKVKACGGKNIAITYNPKSKIAAIADFIVQIPQVSTNRMTPHASDYYCSLNALGLLMNQLTGNPYLDNNEVETYIKNHLVKIGLMISKKIASINNFKRFIICSSDVNYPTALYGAAKFWEAQGVYAIASNLDEFGHGLHMTASESDLVVIIPNCAFPKKRMDKMLEGMQKMGVNFLLFTDRQIIPDNPNIVGIPNITGSLYPYVHHILLQWLVYYYSESNNLIVTTGLGRNTLLDFSKFNDYLR